jgi:pimeloyl-ACP methyl ester carboxylesterase
MLKSMIFFITFLAMNYDLPAQVMDTLVNVGGHKLHFSIIKGKGTPILFESGGGGDATEWKDIIKKLKDSIDATFIAYDRAGMGTSEIDTTKISMLEEVKDLEMALAKLGYTNNLNIVAMSLGGSYSILFASRNPERIKGCIFIDIALPCFMTKENAKEIKNSLRDVDKKVDPGLYYIKLNYEKNHELLRQTVYPSNIPTTVISSDIPPFKELGPNDSIQWKNCQRSFGALPNHTYVLAKNCDHFQCETYPGTLTEIIKMYRRKKR